MKAIMIQGTGSGVGKSIIVMGLCKILRDMGYKVAPFKAQNMSNNATVTPQGFEIAYAQWLQALASGIEPIPEMNPILLKPTSDVGAQLVVLGKMQGNFTAEEYQKLKDELFEVVVSSLKKLLSEFDFVVVEGAGSPAEINLKDIANMKVASALSIPVIIVGDIERGGVFASLLGTIKLLKPKERKLVKGFIINKFRGDKKILSPGIEFIAKKTKIDFLGVIPYVDISIPEEDTFSNLTKKREIGKGNKKKVAVIRLPFISNFTDFEPFRFEDVEFRWAFSTEDIQDVDIIIIPGSKSVSADLKFLKSKGFFEKIKETDKIIFGICGGLQMLGRKILDPFGVESNEKVSEGLGIIPAETILKPEKKLGRVKGIHLETLEYIEGYEIHKGETYFDDFHPLFKITQKNSENVEYFDGYQKENVFGTYLHGIFECDNFRSFILKKPSKIIYRKKLMDEISKFAEILKENLNIEKIFQILTKN